MRRQCIGYQRRSGQSQYRSRRGVASHIVCPEILRYFLFSEDGPDLNSKLRWCTNNDASSPVSCSFSFDVDFYTVGGLCVCSKHSFHAINSIVTCVSFANICVDSNVLQVNWVLQGWLLLCPKPRNAAWEVSGPGIFSGSMRGRVCPRPTVLCLRHPDDPKARG